jgi:hypothetical protein
MIYKIAPKYGRKNPLIYLSICSTSGSVSIMFIKAFGIALKMTFAGNNQFTHPSTYVFVVMVVGCILTQMNYFNKALSQFSTNMYVPNSLPRHRHGNCQGMVKKANSSQRQSPVLRHLHNMHTHRILSPLPGLQHHLRR